MEMIDEKLLKGTTTIGLVCNGGVVLASERRATIGSFIASKSARKIYQVDERMALTTAGLVGDAQTLARIISVESKLYRMRRSEPMTVRAMATLLANILNSHRIFPYYVQLLAGGVDRYGPSLYSLDPVGGQIDEKEMVATGSGSPIAYGILEERYTKKMVPDEGVELAVRALHTTMKRDAASGEAIEVVKITKDEYKQIKEEDILKIRDSLQ
jgi:proteasome beta subunit